MVKRRKNGKAAKNRPRKIKARAGKVAKLPRLYHRACNLAVEGRYPEARRLYETLELKAGEKLRALIHNDMAVLAGLEGDIESARKGFAASLALDQRCGPAKENLALLEEIEECPTSPDAEVQKAGELGKGTLEDGSEEETAGKVAIISFLFNWPSTGGGTVHTYELALFLARAGFAVRHIYARFDPWAVGKVEARLPYTSEVLEFSEADWNVPAIQARFRQAVDAFAPDHVIITDSWNMKPILAEAVEAYPYILRFQAMECFCPLNNVRLLAEDNGRFRQCPHHQLASPAVCSQCVRDRGHQSGSLHQAERALAGVGTPGYHERLLRALREAEAVLVVNPLHEAMISPYTDRVRVVTAGMDPVRFPWPSPCLPVSDSPCHLFFAGLVEEWMKGFEVLHEACAILWRKRRDFELVATGDPPGQVDVFTRFIGWQSQEDLPDQLYAADVLVMPTIAQEALGRTAVEAMAAGRPVVASRSGGLPFTVIDGATGLLCEPGDAADLAAKIERLLDAPELRSRLGLAGRRRFEEHYAWPVIIEKHYRPLLCRLKDNRELPSAGKAQPRKNRIPVAIL